MATIGPKNPFICSKGLNYYRSSGKWTFPPLRIALFPLPAQLLSWAQGIELLASQSSGFMKTESRGKVTQHTWAFLPFKILNSLNSNSRISVDPRKIMNWLVYWYMFWECDRECAGLSSPGSVISWWQVWWG